MAALDSVIGRYAVIHTSDALCRVWAHVCTTLMRKGRPISSADAWIAAPALRLDAPLLSHNAQHFEGIERLSLISRGDSAETRER